MCEEINTQKIRETFPVNQPTGKRPETNSEVGGLHGNVKILLVHRGRSCSTPTNFLFASHIPSSGFRLPDAGVIRLVRLRLLGDVQKSLRPTNSVQPVTQLA